MSNSFERLVGRISLIATLVLGTSALARAESFSTFLTPGQFNIFEDTSHEAFFDTGSDNKGTFGVGDVIVGFVRIETKTVPNAADLNNSTYVIFSQQVTSISGSTVQFGATTVSGLQITDLISGASSGAILAFFTSNAAAYSTNLITTAPSNQVDGATVTLADYIEFLTANGSLQMSFGLGTGDLFTAVAGASGIPSTNDILSSGSSIDFFSFGAALSVLQNNTGIPFADDVACALPGLPPGSAQAQLCLTAGAILGANGTTPVNFLDGSELLANSQCDSDNSTFCGFTDNADFVVHPTQATQVPEPASMFLLAGC